MYGLVNELVTSHLDFYNSIFMGLPKSDINLMQRVHNAAAKLVLKYCSKYSSATHALEILHWLPVEQRIISKVLIVVHKCLHNQAPEYLKSL